MKRVIQASSRQLENSTQPQSWFLGVGVLILFCSIASAQKDTGGLAGLVRDSSGAVIPGAKITLADVERGAQLSATTNAQGEFSISPLKIGRYRVTAEKSGFKKTVAGPITVNVDEKPSVNLILSVGDIHEVVTVTTQAPLLETETSDLSFLVDSRQAETLPLNGRNYAQLALLGAGIAPSEPGSRVEGSYGFSSNGSRALQNNHLLNGIDNNSNLGDVLTGQAYVIQPSVDAIQEFKVQTNAYSVGFSNYLAKTGLDSHSLFANPQFTSDLDIMPASPAVNAGNNLGTNVVGSVDFAGNPRAENGKINIGAYEQ